MLQASVFPHVSSLMAYSAYSATTLTGFLSIFASFATLFVTVYLYILLFLYYHLKIFHESGIGLLCSVESEFSNVFWKCFNRGNNKRSVTQDYVRSYSIFSFLVLSIA